VHANAVAEIWNLSPRASDPRGSSASQWLKDPSEVKREAVAGVPDRFARIDNKPLTAREADCSAASPRTSARSPRRSVSSYVRLNREADFVCFLMVATFLRFRLPWRKRGKLHQTTGQERIDRAWRVSSEAVRSARPVTPVFPTMSTPKIYVCGVPELDTAFSNAFTHVISIWDPEWIDRGGVEHQLKKRLAGETRIHIAYFHDCSVEEPGRRLPAENDLREILTFAADLKPEAHVLIHCWAGISRSTAVAYAILCQFTGPGRESDCIEAILAVRPQAFPNSLIVDLADRILERKGAMRQACEKIISKVYLRSGMDDAI
jgi:predicted protein tyrosine phosphatase